MKHFTKIINDLFETNLIHVFLSFVFQNNNFSIYFSKIKKKIKLPVLSNISLDINLEFLETNTSAI